MALRIFTASFVVLIVFPVCYYAWFWALFNMVPSEFGMPTYEEEIELASLVGSVAFSVVPAVYQHQGVWLPEPTSPDLTPGSGTENSWEAIIIDERRQHRTE